jgi:hypothetical protein
MMRGAPPLHPRRSSKPKHCKRCGGFHAGQCALTKTFSGALTRPELVEGSERRERLKRMGVR